MVDRPTLPELANGEPSAELPQLIARHLDWVYSLCRRSVRDPELAEDITQDVFLILIKKAARLPHGANMSGWIFNTVRYCCNNALRNQRTRRRHELAAAQIRSEPAATEVPMRDEELIPLLDEQLARLGQADRTALLLRYYERRSLRDVGNVLGISEEAAKKRVQRAVEKLRTRMTRKQIPLRAEALTTILADKLVQPAPAKLTAAILAHATHGTTAIVMSASQSKISAHVSLKALASGKTALAATGAVLATALVAAGITVALAKHSHSKAPEKLIISRATTRLTGPLTKDGLVDYAAAFNKRFGKGVTPQNNAAVPLLILFRPQSFQGGSYKMAAGKMVYVPDKQWGHELRSALGISKRDLIGPQYIGFQTFRKHADPMAIPDVALPDKTFVPAPGYVTGRFQWRPWRKRDNPWAAGWLRVSAGFIKVAESAANRQRFFVPWLTPGGGSGGKAISAYSLLPPLGEIQWMGTILEMRAMLELGRNKTQACESLLLASHRAASLMSRECNTNSCMAGWCLDGWTSMADASLANSGKLSSSQDIAYMHQMMRLSHGVPLWKVANTTNRWLILSQLEQMRPGAHEIIENANGADVHVTAPADSARISQAMAAVNDCYDQLVAALKKKHLMSQEKAITAIAVHWRGELRNNWGYRLANKLLFGQKGKLGMSYARIVYTRAQHRVNRRMDYLSFALAAYLGGHGAFPARLAQLEPKYLPTIPRDPFTGKPFRYTAGPTGCTISSPGEFPPQLVPGSQLPQGPPIIVHLSLPPGKLSP